MTPVPPPAPGHRVWTLFSDGAAVGSYTDHCGRVFASGDMLRDDRDLRRRVLAVVSDAQLILDVSAPDRMPSAAKRRKGRDRT